MSTATPLRAAKYRRISDDREGRELGVTRQDRDLDDLADRRGYVVVADYTDNDVGASTRTSKPRDGYRRMLADARAGYFDVICAYTSKRLTRRPREHEDLIELAETHGVGYAYVRSPSFDLNTANGRMVARILAAQDANESEELAERVSVAYAHRVATGGNGGGPRAFGRERDGTIRASEAAEIRHWCDLILQDGDNGKPKHTLGFLARDLRARGVPTASGGTRWIPSTVRDILLRPSNAGIVVHHGGGRHPLDRSGNWIGEVARDHSAIVDEATAKAVVRRLTAPERKTSPGNVPKWLGSGIYVCGVCGGSDIRVKHVGSTPAPRYVCRSGHVARPATRVDEHVTNVIVARLERADATDLLPKTDGGTDARGLATEAATLRARKDDLATDYADGILDRGQVKTATERIQARLADIDRQLVASMGRSPLADVAGRVDARDVWNRLPLAQQRAILRELATITILPAGRGSRNQPIDHTVIRIEWRQTIGTAEP